MEQLQRLLVHVPQAPIQVAAKKRKKHKSSSLKDQLRRQEDRRLEKRARSRQEHLPPQRTEFTCSRCSAKSTLEALAQSTCAWLDHHAGVDLTGVRPTLIWTTIALRPQHTCAVCQGYPPAEQFQVSAYGPALRSAPMEALREHLFGVSRWGQPLPQCFLA